MADISGKKSWGREAPSRAEGPSVAQPKGEVKPVYPVYPTGPAPKEPYQVVWSESMTDQEVFCAALTGLLANRSLTAEDAVRMAKDIVEEAKKKRT